MIVYITVLSANSGHKKLREVGAKDVVSRSVGFEEFVKKVEEILT